MTHVSAPDAEKDDEAIFMASRVPCLYAITPTASDTTSLLSEDDIATDHVAGKSLLTVPGKI